MHGKIRVVKRNSRNSSKKTNMSKQVPKEDFRNWVADWQSGSKKTKLPSLKDLFPKATLEN